MGALHQAFAVVKLDSPLSLLVREEKRESVMGLFVALPCAIGVAQSHCLKQWNLPKVVGHKSVINAIQRALLSVHVI